jgi:hypothetical protein
MTCITAYILSLPRSKVKRRCDHGPNIRCSILFHLLVPGGKWHTTIFSPVVSARRCSVTFHSRVREPLLPPPSAVMSNSLASG